MGNTDSVHDVEMSSLSSAANDRSYIRVNRSEQLDSNLVCPLCLIVDIRVINRIRLKRSFETILARR